MTRAELQFSQWLRANCPEVFAAAAARAMNPTDVGLSGWGDVFSTIGGTLSTIGSGVVKYGGEAVNAVANFVGSEGGQKALGQIAGLYVASQANKSALDIQLANLASQNPPAPIKTVTEPVTGTSTAVYAPPGQPAQVLTPTIATQLLSSAKQPDYMVPALLGGALILAAVMMRGSR